MAVSGVRSPDHFRGVPAPRLPVLVPTGRGYFFKLLMGTLRYLAPSFLREVAAPARRAALVFAGLRPPRRRSSSSRAQSSERGAPPLPGALSGRGGR